MTTSRATDIQRANELLAPLVGQPLVQFRMGYGVHLELGSDHEVTIETPLSFTADDRRLTVEPLTAEAAGMLLRLNGRRVASAQIEADATLVIAFDGASVSVAPHLSFEAWQVRGPHRLLVVCAPNGDYVAVSEPTKP